jgi:hypothetical protein
MENTMLDKPDPLTDAIETLTLAEVEKRLADLDAKRAAYSLLRRSLSARDRAARRAARHGEAKEVVAHV